MPTVLVAEVHPKTGKRRLLNVIFPRLTDPKAPEHNRWEWPELRVSESSVQGFGLFPASTHALNWANLDRPVVLPYLGKETEVESPTQARVLRSVLCGNFDMVQRSELQTAPGHEWVQDGLYVTQMAKADLAKLEKPLQVIDDPLVMLIQVGAS